MKKRLLSLICAVSIFYLSISSVGAVTWIHFENLNELLNGNEYNIPGAELIIIGNVVDETVTFIEEGFSRPSLYTITSVRITEVISGRVKIGETIKVRNIGAANPQPVPGEDGIFTIVVGAGPFLKVGQNYLLFLRKVENYNSMYYMNPNPGQGSYRINTRGNIGANPMISSLDVLRAWVAGFFPGHVRGEKRIEIADAIEIFKHLADMDSVIQRGGFSWQAALITPMSQKSGKPGIADAIEIFKKLAGMESLLR